MYLGLSYYKKIHGTLLFLRYCFYVHVAQVRRWNDYDTIAKITVELPQDILTLEIFNKG